MDEEGFMPSKDAGRNDDAAKPQTSNGHQDLDADSRPAERPHNDKNQGNTIEKDYKDRGRHSSRSPRPRSRSSSRDEYRHRRRRSRSKSRDRHHKRRYHSSRSRSRDRYRRRRDRSRDRYRRDHRRYRHQSSSDEEYGYRPRRKRDSPERNRIPVIEDPFAKLRAASAAATAPTTGNAPATDPQAIARQMQQQQLRARQLVLHQQASSAVAVAHKTQREVYVGNLIPGVITVDTLTQLFNATLQAAFPERCGNGTIDPVIHINMNPEGKYCFIELLSSEMATACLQLSGQLTIAGATLSIGRPAGYVDPVKAAQSAQSAAEGLAKLQAEEQAAQREAGIVFANDDPNSPFLCASGMITANVLSNDSEYNDVVADIRQGFDNYGTVLRMVVPRPDDPSQSEALIGTGGFGKVYVQYLEIADAQKAKSGVEGRLFNGTTVQVEHMQAEAFMKAVGQIS